MEICTLDVAPLMRRHPLTGEPIVPLGFRPNGRAIWPIMGGDSTHDGAADDQDDDAGDEGDDGKVDWEAKFKQQLTINRSLERRGKKDLARIKQLEGTAGDAGAAKDDDSKNDKVDVDKIRSEAKAAAEAEVLKDRVKDKIEAKATAFKNPAHAVAILMQEKTHEDFLDAENKLDIGEITDALKKLGEDSPNLLAQGGRFQGGGDGGARKEKATRPKTLGDAISRHYQDKS